MKELHNITWVEGEDSCRWKGMHFDEYKKLFGTEEEIYADLPGFCVIGNTLYCGETLPDGVPDISLSQIDYIKPYSKLSVDINIEALRAFTKDLDDYYARMTSGDWSVNSPEIFN